jgi:hypothetical protein
VKQFLVCVDGEVIGSSDLEGRDPGMGMLNGPFYPTPAYEKVKGTFELFSAAVDHKPSNETLLASCNAQCDALGLTLRTGDNRTIPTATIRIWDYARDLVDDARELQVATRDGETYERFFAR